MDAQFLESYKRTVKVDRELLVQVARTALRTKVRARACAWSCATALCADRGRRAAEHAHARSCRASWRTA